MAVDRGRKAALYAESGVSEYWLVNLPAGIIEVHSRPVAGRYAVVTPHRRESSLDLGSFPDVSIAVTDILR